MIKLIFLTVLVSATLSSAHKEALNTITSEWAKSDSLFNPKLFKFMLMMPTKHYPSDSTNQIHADYKQTNVVDTPVHSNDVIHELLTNFLVKGGPKSNAHVISDDQEVHKSVPRYIMSMHENTDYNRVDLKHGGKTISNLEVSNVYHCLEEHAAQLGLKAIPTDNGSLKFNVMGLQIELTQELINQNTSWLKPICYMVSMMGLHENNKESNALLFHLPVEKFENLQVSQIFNTILNNALETVKTQLYKQFGESNVALMVSLFKSMTGVKGINDRNRVLAESETDSGDADPTPTPEDE